MAARALSRREREVLAQFAEGKTYKQVARSLCVSVHTVASHLVKAKGKLGARNTAHAVAMTLGADWVRG